MQTNLNVKVMAESNNKIRIGILGASGYTGGELLRLLAGHDDMTVAMLSAERRAGRSLAEVFPHLAAMQAPDLIASRLLFDRFPMGLSETYMSQRRCSAIT